jgi:DNA-binding GntR family transcriptional regulator
LTQITLEGLATLVPGQGYIVNELTAKKVRDVYEVRYTLEALAARQACGRHTPQQLIRLRALIEEFETLDAYDAAGLFEMAKQFHTALIAPCPNEYLQATLTSMWEHPIQRRITMTYRQGPEHQQKMARDHWRILEALKAGDVETVVDVLRFCHDPNGARTTLPV